MISRERLDQIDRDHLWHPYSAMHSDLPVYPVQSAHGVRLRLRDGRELIDGMASWWCVIHGYNHPRLNTAVSAQLERMSHVMFGGLTHEPAAALAERLVQITPPPLQKVFFSDSGSISVEVAMKMAIQYWHATGRPEKKHFVALRGGYHGDSFGAMSVCDPVTGMHTLFDGILPRQYFADQPRCRFGEPCADCDIEGMESLLQNKQDSIAAVIVEPIVQGAGGMWFYSADYLRRLRELCDRYQVLLIHDEIATGFGRSGRLFACEHAQVSPDIMCIGKSLTGGYMTLAATLTTSRLSDALDHGKPGVFMHGPTFMANPLACSVALASIDLLLEEDWQARIIALEQGLSAGLSPCRDLAQVADVRVLGGIGVVEMKQAVDMKRITEDFVEAGVWVRPFGRLVYLMPPYIISPEDLGTLTNTVVKVVATQQ